MGKMKNIDAPIWAIDFEGSSKLGIVEFGAAKIEGGIVTQTRTEICTPKTPLLKRDTLFTGISAPDTLGKKPFAAYADEFCRMRKNAMFAAHNAVVEDSLLRAEVPSPGIVKNFATSAESPDWAPWLDTCVLVKNLYPALASAKLSDVVLAFGIDKELDAIAGKFCPPNRRKWHCALYDALACALIITRICSSEGFEEVSLEWLAKYSGSFKSAQGTLA